MILVSILGDFSSSILPLFYNFKDKTTKHILVYDDFKRDVTKAKEIAKGLERFKQKYSYNFELIEYTLDEDSSDEINKCSEFIASQTKNQNDIYINTTDGFSTLTTLLNHNLMSDGVQFLAYDMFDNEYNLLNNKSLRKHKLQHNLNIQDHFLLKGYSTKHKEFKEFAHRHEKTIITLFEEYHHEFDSYTKLSRKKYKKVTNLPHGKIKKAFVSMGLEDMDAHNALLTGGLFEYYIYNLLKDLDYDDIEVGLVVSREINSSNVPNEFDILIMKNNHLHNIECKYRKMVNMNELIYKYTALSNIVDEDGTTIIILKNPIDYEKTNIYDGQAFTPLKRAALNNIVFKGGVHLNSKLFSIYIKSLLQLRED